MYRTNPKPSTPERISPAEVLVDCKLKTIDNATVTVAPNHPGAPKIVIQTVSTWLPRLDRGIHPTQMDVSCMGSFWRPHLDPIQKSKRAAHGPHEDTGAIRPLKIILTTFSRPKPSSFTGHNRHAPRP